MPLPQCYKRCDYVSDLELTGSKVREDMHDDFRQSFLQQGEPLFTHSLRHLADTVEIFPHDEKRNQFVVMRSANTRRIT